MRLCFICLHYNIFFSQGKHFAHFCPAITPCRCRQKKLKFHTEVFKVLCTCRQMAKFANEKRRFGEVALHAKFKHVATQFAHRGITHGERMIPATDRCFQSFAYLQAKDKICKRKQAFRRGYLAHKIETRCNTICTPCITYGERTAKKAFFKRK